MILSDRDIKGHLAAGRIVIDPLGDGAVQPSSVDLRVGDTFRVFANHRRSYIDVRDPMDDLTESVEATEDSPFVLHPGEFVLGSTLERIELPDDLVARVEGKSSLGRLGLLIHSSLPASEEILVLTPAGLTRTSIGAVVKEGLPGYVVGFDHGTLEVGYHEITGWYEGPVDRIFEVSLRSGRSVRVTAGHNLFTIGRDGRVARVPTRALAPGTRVAIPGVIMDPPLPPPVIELLALVPQGRIPEVSVEGPTVARLFEERPNEVRDALREIGVTHWRFYETRSRLPWRVARQFVMPDDVVAGDRLRFRQARHALPARISVTPELAWLLGIYVAEGYRRPSHVVVATADDAILDRVESVFRGLGLPTHRRAGRSVTCMSALFSAALDWMGCGGDALDKRVPGAAFGWPGAQLDAFVDGFIDGDGSRERTRDSSSGGREAPLPASPLDATAVSGQVVGPAERALGRAGSFEGTSGQDQPEPRPTIPTRSGSASPHDARRIVGGRREGLHLGTSAKGLVSDLLLIMARLEEHAGLDRRVRWDDVVAVSDTGVVEPVYDLEVRPNGRHVENFMAGTGGVFVSNTAGFVDAGFRGHLTLELSNVSNLPIAIYPGMLIGQLCLFQMTSPAERPYGSPGLGSKYQDQSGPTPSRIHREFHEDDG